MIKLITDNGGDLTLAEAKDFDIDILPLTNIDEEGNEYIVGEDISLDDYYQTMVDGKVYTTSQVSMGVFYDRFKSYLDQGVEIIYIGLSGALSGTVESATSAAKQLKSEYPQGKITIIDSLSATVGQRLMCIKAKLLLDQGAGANEVQDLVKKMQENQVLLFSVGDLNYLYRGGRLSKTESLVGGLLGIIPILGLDSTTGSLETVTVARGKNNFYKKYKAELEKRMTGPLVKDQDFYLVGTSENDQVDFFRQFLVDNYQINKNRINYCQLSGLIGAHTGPVVSGIMFYNDPNPFKSI